MKLTYDITSILQEFANKLKSLYATQATVKGVSDKLDEVEGKIPTVNDATLTVKRNGTIVDTFTANAATDKAIDIIVPIKTSDLSNDSFYTKKEVDDKVAASGIFDATQYYNKTDSDSKFVAKTDVENALSADSTNPVQNKVVKAAIDNKLDKAASAASAAKLDSNAGSETQPIYFADGKPVATTYSLSKSVPSDAKFTDHITAATTSGSGNAVTAVESDAEGNLTVTKGTTFLIAGDIVNKADKASTLAGYGITDAKIDSGVITLGDATITPLTEHQNLDHKADLASPTFTGTPTAPTPAAGTNTTQLATTAFVLSEIESKLSAADAMLFKGTIGEGGSVSELPAKHEAGWTYKVTSAGTIAGQQVEAGDMIVCIAEGETASDADWSVVQTNIDGAVTGPQNSVDGNVAVFDSTSGKVIKDSGFSIAASVPANAKFTDTTYSVMGAASASADGKEGLVAQPKQGDQGKFLRGDATWQELPVGNLSTKGLVQPGTNIDVADGVISVKDLTGATATTTGQKGLAPAPSAGKQDAFLRGDGTWDEISVEITAKIDDIVFNDVTP